MAQEIWKKIPWIRQTETRADYCHEKTSCLFIYFKRFFPLRDRRMVLRDPLYICGSVDEGRCENDGDYLCYHVSHLCGRCHSSGYCKMVRPMVKRTSRFLKADREEISPVALKLRHGLIYMVLIYTGEYIAGSFLMAKGLCPWDYSQWPDQIHGVIRLAFIPFWFGTGLLFESLCTH